jgi:hypothetical protein
MRWLSLFAAVLLLAGCHGGGSIDSARIVRVPEPVLDAGLRLQPTAQMLEALDRGVTLTLRLRLRASFPGGELDSVRRIGIRYLPLAQQYQLTDLDTQAARNFPRRAQLLAALDRVRLPLDAQWAGLPIDAVCRLSLALDIDALPATLRLPALLSADWRLDPQEFRWTSGS